MPLDLSFLREAITPAGRRWPKAVLHTHALFHPEKPHPKMKKPLLFLFCLFGATTLFAQSPNNVILLLNIGQSNGVGRATPDAANEVPATSGAYWYKQSTNTLEPLVDAVGEDVSQATDRSMNPMLGKRIKELTGRDVIIVPAAVGNSFIRYWLKEDHSLYERAKVMWQAALAYCTAHNITVEAKYVHWLQGENDAGVTETDGYYVMLNQLVNDLVSDVGVEKVFATRIGYDPNYTSAAGSEKIMKAQKILNFNNPAFIMDSYAPATFSYANGKMLSDETHHSLLGLNQEAEDIAAAINYYRTTGAKVQLTENVAALQSVNSGTINLTPNWNFEFDNSLAEAAGNVIMKTAARDWLPTPTPSYSSDGGIVINKYNGLVASRPFSASTFTIELRLRMTSPEAWSAVLGDGSGGVNNKLVLYHNNNTSALYVQFGTAAGSSAWDLGNTVNMGSYHTLKFTQANGVLKFYLDGVQKGTSQVSDGVFTASYLGLGEGSHTMDTDAVIDFFRIKNSVDNNPLPIKFKTFKATNVK